MGTLDDLFNKREEIDRSIVGVVKDYIVETLKKENLLKMRDFTEDRVYSASKSKGYHSGWLGMTARGILDSVHKEFGSRIEKNHVEEAIVELERADKIFRDKDLYFNPIVDGKIPESLNEMTEIKREDEKLREEAKKWVNQLKLSKNPSLPPGFDPDDKHEYTFKLPGLFDKN